MKYIDEYFGVALFFLDIEPANCTLTNSLKEFIIIYVIMLKIGP